MDVWVQVLAAVAKRVNQQVYDTWFRSIVFDGRDQTILRIRVPNENYRKWMLEHYAHILDEAVKEAFGRRLQVVVSAESHSAPASPSNMVPETNPTPIQLNPKYTFGSFVVGSSNQFACAAAAAVAERPSKA